MDGWYTLGIIYMAPTFLCFFILVLDYFTHILQGYFTGAGTIVRLEVNISKGYWGHIIKVFGS